MTQNIQPLSEAEMLEIEELIARKQPPTDEQLLRFGVTVRLMTEELLEELVQRVRKRSSERTDIRSLHFAEPGEVSFDPHRHQSIPNPERREND